MGSLFGGYLADVCDVCLYSRNPDYVEAVGKNGLIMTQGDKKWVKRIQVTSDPAKIGPCDFALVYVKGTGTDKAVQDAMISCITPETLVVSLQNGIGNVEIMQKYLPDSQIAYGFSVLTSDHVAPGHIELTTLKMVPTYIKALAEDSKPKLQHFVDLINKSGLETYISPDIDDKIWRKLLVNCSQNTLCALLKLNVTEVTLTTPESYEIVKQIVFEVSDVARAKGINITRQEALQHVINVTNSVPGHVPSMVFDILNKKPTEIGVLNGAVVSEAKRLGVAVPVNEIIMNMIKALERNYNSKSVHHKGVIL